MKGRFLRLQILAAVEPDGRRVENSRRCMWPREDHAFGLLIITRLAAQLRSGRRTRPDTVEFEEFPETIYREASSLRDYRPRRSDLPRGADRTTDYRRDRPY